MPAAAAKEQTDDSSADRVDGEARSAYVLVRCFGRIRSDDLSVLANAVAGRATTIYASLVDPIRECLEARGAVSEDAALVLDDGVRLWSAGSGDRRVVVTSVPDRSVFVTISQADEAGCADVRHLIFDDGRWREAVEKASVRDYAWGTFADVSVFPDASRPEGARYGDLAAYAVEGWELLFDAFGRTARELGFGAALEERFEAEAAEARSRMSAVADPKGKATRRTVVAALACRIASKDLASSAATDVLARFEAFAMAEDMDRLAPDLERMVALAEANGNGPGEPSFVFNDLDNVVDVGEPKPDGSRRLRFLDQDRSMVVSWSEDRSRYGFWYADDDAEGRRIGEAAYRGEPDAPPPNVSFVRTDGALRREGSRVGGSVLRSAWAAFDLNVEYGLKAMDEAYAPSRGPGV